LELIGSHFVFLSRQLTQARSSRLLAVPAFEKPHGDSTTARVGGIGRLDCSAGVLKGGEVRRGISWHVDKFVESLPADCGNSRGMLTYLDENDASSRAFSVEVLTVLECLVV
jgi:hypothetical protein